MQSEKERVALGSIFASAGLTVAKGIVGVFSGSLAILSEAAHSFTDLIATIITYVAIRVSGKPADEEHHYGHGKIESVTALAATALLFLLAGIVAWESVGRLIGAETHSVVATPWAFGVIVVSIIVDFWRARLLNRVARRTKSQALEADALHFTSDMWSSLAVLAGLAGVALGHPKADLVAALIVCLFICLAGWRLGRRTVATLTDTAPAGAAERIATIARKVRDVVAVERVRVRAVGPVLFVEVTAAVNRTLPLDRVSAVKAEIDRAIRVEMPEAEVEIITEPRALDDETVLERVMVIARNRALAVHHVTVHHLRDRLAVSLDLEVDGALPLGEAHAIADALEAAIAEELGGEIEVETHIEPLQSDGSAGRDASTDIQANLARALASLVRPGDRIGDVHNVRVRETPHGLVINFHCRAMPSLPVADVHEAVDALERRLMESRPGIHRVIGHAEPMR